MFSDETLFIVCCLSFAISFDKRARCSILSMQWKGLHLAETFCLLIFRPICLFIHQNGWNFYR